MYLCYYTFNLYFRVYSFYLYIKEFAIKQYARLGWQSSVIHRLITSVSLVLEFIFVVLFSNMSYRLVPSEQ